MSKVKELQKHQGQLGHTLVECEHSFWEVSTINLKGAGRKEPFGPFASFLDGLFKRDDFMFETMVFKANQEGHRTTNDEYFLKRYPTAEEALIGDKKVVNQIKNGKLKLKKRDFIKEGW